MPIGPATTFAQAVVFGPAQVVVGLGTSGPLQFLGICAQVPKLNFTPMETPIPVDPAGPNGYGDVQDMGEYARLSMQLTAIDTTVMSSTIAWRKGFGSGTPFNADGQAGLRGTPIFAAGRHIRLGFQFPAQTGAGPIFFPVTRLLQPRDFDAGTTFSRFGFVFEAWSVYSVDNSGNLTWSPLYTNTIA